MQWMGIWVHSHTVMHLEVGGDYWKIGGMAEPE
jgi:hypothetical protein